jgi:hypothetical protein
MTDRKMSRERAKAALKELKKNKRLPKNYPLSAYYRLHLLQEKGERLLADTRRRVGEREQVIAGVDATADDSFEVSLLEIVDDDVIHAVDAETSDMEVVSAE